MWNLQLQRTELLLFLTFPPQLWYHTSYKHFKLYYCWQINVAGVRHLKLVMCGFYKVKKKKQWLWCPCTSQPACYHSSGSSSVCVGPVSFKEPRIRQTGNMRSMIKKSQAASRISSRDTHLLYSNFYYSFSLKCFSGASPFTKLRICLTFYISQRNVKM